MKKLLIIAIAILGFTTTIYAQDIAKNALGLRLGDSDGFGGEVSYQTRLNDSNRLEFDLGWRSGKDFDGYKIAGLYQWVMELEERLNWYVGAGGGFGSYESNKDNNDEETFLFVAGDIGIEYNFKIPLLISLDFRPELGFGDFRDDIDLDIAFGIRYQF